jgi:hypothetical protein
MLRPRAYIRLSIALAFASVTLFTTPAHGQSPASRPSSSDNDVAAAQGPRLSSPEKKVGQGPRASDLENDVAAVKAENAAVRDQLRKMEENQKALLELVERLQQRLDGFASADVMRNVQPPGSAQVADAAAASTVAADGPAASTPAAAASAPAPPVPIQATAKDDERYKDGIIIWQTSKEAKVPFLLRFNNNTQLRYMNSLSSSSTYTDHLGNVRDVLKRNDITVNRSMFILGGYIFDERVRYSLTVWTSAGAASIVVAGNIGWQFSKKLTLTAGYTGVPGSRSLVNTFPYYTATDRSMADNFFRPGFTQGMWANGELGHGLNYIAFVGNALNSINISATKIDTHLLTSGSLWWEPFGRYGEPGKSVNMYDDYFAKEKTRIRLGTSFTHSREDRFTNTDVSNPENTALHNSDGVLTFATGAFAPGVTVDKALYKMWAIDGGLKYSGLAINTQYFFRWLSDFVADGPLPLSSTFDHGGELSASYFVKPKKWMMYVRGSWVNGQFRNANEYGAGLRWYFVPTERLWLNAELMRVNRSPYSGAFTPYTSGLNGWVPMVQTIIAF